MLFDCIYGVPAYTYVCTIYAYPSVYNHQPKSRQILFSKEDTSFLGFVGILYTEGNMEEGGIFQNLQGVKKKGRGMEKRMIWKTGW